MRWGWFALVLLAVVIAQGSFTPRWPMDLGLDLFAAFALACAWCLPAEEACLAGWIIGFIQDVGSLQPLGLHALTLGLATWGLTRIRDLVNRELWWVRWISGFAVLFPAQLLVSLRILWGKPVEWWRFISEPFTTALVGALLAALLALLPAALVRKQRYPASRW